MRPRFQAFLFTAILAVAAQILYPGCATMFNGPTQNVAVRSKPRGARVFIDGQPAGNTPVTAAVSRWGFHKLRIEADGFEPMEFPLVKNFNSNTTANLFVLCPPGMLIDLATGAIFELELPKNPPPGVRPGRWENGDTGSFSSVVIVAEMRPQQHGRLVGQMKRK